MTLKEFAANINKLLEDRPETADFHVVTSKDDEGNGFNLVHYTPQVGNYDGEEKEFKAEVELNAVCVN